MHTARTRALCALAAAAALTSLGLAAAGSAGATPATSRARPPTAYVANSGGDMVTPINTTTNRAGTPIKVGTRPGQIVLSPDGSTAYVIARDAVVPISTATNTALAPIAIAGGAGYIALAPGGKTLYVTGYPFGSGQQNLTPISIATNTALPPITLKSGTPWGNSPIAFAPDGKTAYIASTLGTVTRVNLVTGKALQPIKLPRFAENGNAYLAMTPNGKTLYATESGPYQPGHTVFPISTASGKVGTPIKVGNWPAAMAITPDGKTLYVASTGSGATGCVQPAQCGPVAGSGSATVTPISTATNKPGHAIRLGPVGNGPSPLAIAITPAGRTAYVGYSNSYSNSTFNVVVPIRTSTSTALKPISTRFQIGGIAITPNARTVYVTLDRFTSSGTSLLGYVLPIATATNTAGTLIKVGHLPSFIAITP